VLAFGTALLALWNAALPVTLPGVLAAAATAGSSWFQAKRHHDLRNAYSVTARDLALVHAAATAIRDDETLSIYVEDAETAMSREHTLWQARRTADPPVVGGL